jgi:hypothetical protein
MNTHPTYYSGGSGTYAGTQRKLRDQDGNLTGETVMLGQRPKNDGLTPQTAKTSSSGGEWVDVSGGGKMAANTRPQRGNGEVEEAAGMGEAMSSLLSQASGMKFDKRTGQNVYKSGRFKGLTTAQVEEKGKQMWDTVSPAIREKYAARVQNRPALSERNQPAEQQFQQAGRKQPMAAFSPTRRDDSMAAFGSGIQRIGDEESTDQRVA